ncbi:hypothetical protein F7725_013414 [Dissostichus mawsoni]|uniref:DUF4371 domain-containing protein n=1 Tax=Dissostichus mawsoni TaxID=36200 RepID=A0A7J5YPY5_DISMA|nr:hypothetical protein F7725_013414 [Dissostichus mawsoni]
MRAIGNYSPTNKLICQTYDGASCMSGQHGGVQALVKAHCPNALFIQHKQHSSSQTVSANLDAFHTFFSRLCKRSALLCEVNRAVRVPGGSAVGWNFKSRGYMPSMKDTGRSDRIMSTLSALKATRTDETFSRIYDETVKAVGEPMPQRKRLRRGWDDLEQGVNQHQEGDEETFVSFRRLYFQIVDGTVLHMTQRFADMEHLNFFRILEHTSFASFCKPAAFPNSELAQLINKYPFFDEQKLRNELHTLYNNRRSLSDVNSRYSETLRPVMSTRMSPVTTFMRGGRPPTPLGQEKPVPCIEQGLGQLVQGAVEGGFEDTGGPHARGQTEVLMIFCGLASDKEGWQEDLREEALGVSLGTVEPLDDEAMKLTQLQPPALQLEAALPLQDLRLWDGHLSASPGGEGHIA